MEKNKKLILYSTTRQYNPGDEFILFGVMNLIESIGINQNPVIYNRNQEINQPLSFLNPLRKIKMQSRWIKVLGTFLRISQVDNSFKDIHSLDIYDMVIFAGSPEWASSRLNPLYTKLKSFNKPILYLGLGSFQREINVSKSKSMILNKAKLITYRNKDLDVFFEEFSNAVHLPCPALFSVKTFNHEIKMGKIAIVFGVANASKGNHVSNKAMDKMKLAYEHLCDMNYNVEIVCHYIDEISFAKEIFPKAKIHYSYDAKDYEKIYKEFEYVVTSRVHAIGMCASLSIPGTLIGHDGRASTVKGFLADIINDGEENDVFLRKIIQRIKKSNELSKSLKSHKKDFYIKYQEILKSRLNLND